MITIWKFEVPINDKVTKIEMPMGARIVHVGAQHTDTLTFWAMVDKDLPTQWRSFTVIGTGHEFANYWLHVGSVLMEPFVWHLLEATHKARN